jgi:integrase
MPRKKIVRTRRARGTGSIFPDKRRGGYVGRVPVGKLPSGKTRYVEVRADSQAECVRLMRDAAPPGPDVTVGEWADRWLAGLRVRRGSHKAYTMTVNTRIKPAFGSLRLDALTPWHIEAAAADWADPRSASPLASGTLATALGRVAACLQAAVRAQLIPRNPAAIVRRPRQPRPKFDLFSVAELRAIIDLALTRREWYPFAVSAATGCRIGEAMALRPTDFDGATGDLTISRTLGRDGTHGPPKSARSHRTIRPPELIRGILPAMRAAYKYETQRLRWISFLKRLGLRERNLHQLRHSVASHALAAKVPLPNVARDLGDTVDTIVKTYLHPTAGEDVCGTMERLLGGAEPARSKGRKSG